MQQVADLAGAELDFWVAKSAGLPIEADREPDAGGRVRILLGEPTENGIKERFSPHQNPAQAYLIIAGARIGTRPVGASAWAACSPDGHHFSMSDECLLEAALRCFVKMHYGEAVDDALFANNTGINQAEAASTSEQPAQANNHCCLEIPDCRQHDAWL